MINRITLKSLMAVSAVALVAACAQPAADEGAAMTTVTIDQLNSGVSSADAAAKRAQASAERAEAAAARAEAAAERGERAFQRSMRK
ncbi:MAG: hypothetical protein WCZ23_01770 [Rhodospirillaceae bacterium]